MGKNIVAFDLRIRYKWPHLPAADKNFHKPPRRKRGNFLKENCS